MNRERAVELFDAAVDAKFVASLHGRPLPEGYVLADDPGERYTVTVSAITWDQTDLVRLIELALYHDAEVRITSFARGNEFEFVEPTPEWKRVVG